MGGAEKVRLSIGFTKEDWLHAENENMIRHALLKEENQNDQGLWHNLGAAISSSANQRMQQAIDALEASVAIKPTSVSLEILEKIYWKEAQYQGAAWTACRQLQFIQDQTEDAVKQGAPAGESFLGWFEKDISHTI